MRPADVTLQGSFVRLAPLDLERDIDGLWAVSNGSAEVLGELLEMGEGEIAALREDGVV